MGGAITIITVFTLVIGSAAIFRIFLDTLPSPPPESPSEVDLIRQMAKVEGYILNRPAYLAGREIYVPKKDEWKPIYSTWTGEKTVQHRLMDDYIIV